MSGRDYSPALEHAMKIKIIIFVSLITLLSTLGTAQRNSTLPGPVHGEASGNVDWSQFNFDAGHDGYNPLETTLSPANVGTVTLQWSYGISNAAFEGSPSVSGGIAYFGVENTTLHNYFAVLALNANTGDLIWNYQTTGEPFGAPAVAFGWVYVAGGNVYALDANSGALHWQWQPQTGSCQTSPTLVNGILYVVCGTYNHPATVYALNAATGTVMWQYVLSAVSNVPPAAASGMVYVTSQDGGVYALNGSTGVVIWSRQLGISPTPRPVPYVTYGGLSVANSAVYIEAADPNSRQRGYNVYALDANTGATIWKSPYVGGANTSPAIANGMVYVGTASGLSALNASTGTTVWQYQAPPNYGEPYSPVVANSVVYAPFVNCCGFETGTYTLAAVDANTGVGLWWSPSAIFSTFDNYPTVAVVNGMIYTSVNAYGFGAFGLPN
jgi:outer membrane protein assembly factor BamB